VVAGGTRRGCAKKRSSAPYTIPPHTPFAASPIGVEAPVPGTGIVISGIPGGKIFANLNPESLGLKPETLALLDMLPPFAGCGHPLLDSPDGRPPRILALQCSARNSARPSIEAKLRSSASRHAGHIAGISSFDARQTTGNFVPPPALKFSRNGTHAPSCAANAAVT
jgi:hypothetical protein